MPHFHGPPNGSSVTTTYPQPQRPRAVPFIQHKIASLPDIPTFINRFGSWANAPTDKTPGAESNNPRVAQIFDKAGGWISHVHPDGWRYFYHTETHAVTDDLDVVLSFEPNRFFLPSSANCGHEIELVIHTNGILCTYVNHTTMYASQDIEITKRADLTTLEVHELQVEYWNFMYQHPSHRKMDPEILTAATQTLLCYLMEGLRGHSGAGAPFVPDECRELLACIDQINQQQDCEKYGAPSLSSARAGFIYWIMLNVAQHRAINLYGLRMRSEDVYQPIGPGMTIWFTLLSILFFGAPFGHLEHINTAYKCSQLYGDVKTWPLYISNLVTEWSNFNIAATVLLSASVSFLAVPGMDPTTRIVSLLSVVLTLGSIMSGVFLVWRHQVVQDKVEYNVINMSDGLNNEPRKHILAVALSIPFVMLTWGVISFLLVIVLYSFLGFQTTIEGVNSRINHGTSFTVLGSSIGVMVVMFLVIGFFGLVKRRFST